MKELEEKGAKLLLPIGGKIYTLTFVRQETYVPANVYQVTFGEASVQFSVDRVMLRFQEAYLYSEAGYAAAKLERLIEENK